MLGHAWRLNFYLVLNWMWLSRLLTFSVCSNGMLKYETSFKLSFLAVWNQNNFLHPAFCWFDACCTTGIIVSFTIPALYDKYEDRVDRYAGMVHQKISKHYKIVDENVIRRLPRRFSKSKDAWSKTFWYTSEFRCHVVFMCCLLALR